MKDLDSRDYDIDEIDEDPRFSRAREEAMFIQCLLTGGIFLVIGVAFLTGGGQDPATMKFLLGWPLWFVYSFLTAIGIIAIGLVWLVLKFRTPSFAAVADDKEVK